MENSKKKNGSKSKKSRETKFIVGDSMIKKINGYLLTKPINHKSGKISYS